MRQAKVLFHQEKGKQYQHLVVSNNSSVRDTSLVHRIGCEIAEYYGSQYQVYVCTHCNTNNLHSHIIINTVNMVTGKKLSQNKSDCRKLKEYANRIFKKYDLPPIGGKDIYFIKYDEPDDFYDDLYWDEYNEIAYDSQLLEEHYGVTRPFHFMDLEGETQELLNYYKRMEARTGGK